jgi:hypothetical protein
MRSVYNIITLHLVHFTPCIHHPSIIEGDDSYDINAFGFEFVEILDKRREMVGLTSWSEGP